MPTCTPLSWLHKWAWWARTWLVCSQRQKACRRWNTCNTKNNPLLHYSVCAEVAISLWRESRKSCVVCSYNHRPVSWINFCWYIYVWGSDSPNDSSDDHLRGVLEGSQDRFSEQSVAQHTAGENHQHVRKPAGQRVFSGELLRTCNTASTICLKISVTLYLYK